MLAVNYTVPLMITRMPSIEYFLRSQTALVATAMCRVIVRREFPYASRALVHPVVVSCFGIDVVPILIDVGDSVPMRYSGRALLEVNAGSCSAVAALGNIELM